MRLIDADALRETWVCQPGHDFEPSSFVYSIDNAPTVEPASPWHRVEDELPPNAKHPGAFCPKVRVLTRWGVTDGWFNPDMGRNGLWCVLLWFFMGTWKEDDIDFERGDRPKMVWLSQDDVIAWMPIEPPKEETK